MTYNLFDSCSGADRPELFSHQGEGVFRALMTRQTVIVPDDEVKHVMLPGKDKWAFSITVDGSFV